MYVYIHVYMYETLGGNKASPNTRYLQLGLLKCKSPTPHLPNMSLGAGGAWELHYNPHESEGPLDQAHWSPSPSPQPHSAGGETEAQKGAGGLHEVGDRAEPGTDAWQGGRQ